MVTIVGIDYQQVSIQKREPFVLTKEQVQSASCRIMQEENMKGCILVSTCNRTELWLSGHHADPVSLFLSTLLGQVYDKELVECCRIKENAEAVVYCIELACGMHSQIFGEDQILSQLKQSLEEARALHTTDAVLETLFRTAITAAKEIKTSLVLTNLSTTLPSSIVQKLLQQNNQLKGQRCLVIGNGIMGRMMAEELIKAECLVTMTLRQYKKSEAIIPKGCDVILYENRYEALKQCNYLFSATKSQHYTIKMEEVQERLDRSKTYHMIDLAMPRDLDPALQKLNYVRLYDMDYFGLKSSCEEETLAKANQIIKKYADEFMDWFENRGFSIAVQNVSDIVGSLTDAKLTKVYKSIELEKNEKEELKVNIKNASKKAISKLIFEFMQELPSELCKEVVISLEKAARNCL